MKNKKRNKLLLLIVLLLAVTVGYAALATTLKINGTANIGKNTWSIYWANVGDYDMSSTTTVETAARVKPGDTTEVEFEVNLNQPGDYYEFQVDAVNAGTLDAMVGVVSRLVNNDENASLPSYVSLDVTYADGGEVHQYDLLSKATVSGNTTTPTTERYKVRVKFSDDIDPEDLDDIGDESINVVVSIPYDQADSHATPRQLPYTYLYFDVATNQAATTTNRSDVNRNEFIRTATGATPELCMVRPTEDICYSSDDYDWACDGGCTFDPNGTKTQALLARLQAAGVTAGTESSRVYFGNSQTQYCSGEANGNLNCFSTVDYNTEGRYCYCGVNTANGSSTYCGCYD